MCSGILLSGDFSMSVSFWSRMSCCSISRLVGQLLLYNIRTVQFHSCMTQSITVIPVIHLQAIWWVRRWQWGTWLVSGKWLWRWPALCPGPRHSSGNSCRRWVSPAHWRCFHVLMILCVSNSIIWMCFKCQCQTLQCIPCFVTQCIFMRPLIANRLKQLICTTALANLFISGMGNHRGCQYKALHASLCLKIHMQYAR